MGADVLRYRDTDKIVVVARSFTIMWWCRYETLDLTITLVLAIVHLRYLQYGKRLIQKMIIHNILTFLCGKGNLKSAYLSKCRVLATSSPQV